MAGAVGGVTLDDGTRLPIPGVYLLQGDGQPTGFVGLLSEDARERLLTELGAPPALAEPPDRESRAHPGDSPSRIRQTKSDL